MRNLWKTIRANCREHRHFFIIVTLLTLLTTFPTIVYAFRTDVHWLPTGYGRDIYIALWDYWYGMRVLTGQADRLFTDLIYFPAGVSLVFHPLCIPLVLVFNFFHLFMPFSNAYCLTFLFIIWSAALTAYMYALWLCKDKWIALFGAIVFAFSPQIAGLPFWPTIAMMAPIPLALYCCHRGLIEARRTLIALGGLLTGLISIVNEYSFVCALITLGMLLCALGWSRWRRPAFWQSVILLTVAVAFASAWRVLPMLQSGDALDAATAQRGTQERSTDLISFFVNGSHPIIGPLGDALFQTPAGARTSKFSYLGFVPLALALIALADKRVRRAALPWLAPLLLFLVLRLGSVLNVNGIVYDTVLLPKHYLNQLLPMVFSAFDSADLFMLGARLPLAILACFGLASLRPRVPMAARPIGYLALAALLAFEYYVPVKDGQGYPMGTRADGTESAAYLDWLASEDEAESNEIRLINLPMGRTNAKFYLFYQSLHGYPQTEGAISRLPDSAYDYIKANTLLSAWHAQQPVACETATRASYLAGLAQLETDGFSHVVYHRDFIAADAIADSFRNAAPSYHDEYVSVYRVSDLRASCPSAGD